MQNRVCDSVLLNEHRDVACRITCIHGDSDDFEALGLVLLVDVLEVGRLHTTRSAPRRPQVEEDRLTTE